MRLLLLLDNMALVLGALKAAVVAQISATLVAKFVISLATFTIPVRRWIATEDHPADEPFRSKRYRPNMHSDVDQKKTSTTGLTPDSELFTVLSAEAARVAKEGVQPRKPSRVRSCTDAADTSQGTTNTHPKNTRRTCAAPNTERERLNDGEQVRRMESELLRRSPSRADFENSRRLAPGTPRGPTPRIFDAAAMMEMQVLKDGKFVGLLVVHYET